MNITIANLKHSESLSEETHAYTATILVDGVRAFHASNHGTGGADLYRPIEGYTGPTEEEIDEWLKTNTPPIESGGMQLENCLELVVGDLIEEKLIEKRLKRMLKTKILVISQENGKDALFSYKGKPTAQNLEAMRKHISSNKIKGELVNEGGPEVFERAKSLA